MAQANGSTKLGCSWCILAVIAVAITPALVAVGSVMEALS